jgi:hypothetical protein
MLSRVRAHPLRRQLGAHWCIDQPLTVIRAGHPAGLTTIVPHANYRGVYRAGTTRGGALLNCAPTGNCVYVNWPAPFLQRA